VPALAPLLRLQPGVFGRGLIAVIGGCASFFAFAAPGMARSGDDIFGGRQCGVAGRDASEGCWNEPGASEECDASWTVLGLLAGMAIVEVVDVALLARDD
jgi:hypothetical protein